MGKMENPSESKGVKSPERKKTPRLSLDIPSARELQRFYFDELYKRWKQNHLDLGIYLMKHRSKIVRFGLHGCAQQDLNQLLSSAKGDIRVGTFADPACVRPLELLIVLYGICEYTQRYAFSSRRASEQGGGGVVLVKYKVLPNGRMISPPQDKLHTGGMLAPVGKDDKETKALVNRLDQNSNDEIPAVSAALDDWVKFPLGAQEPKLIYSAQQARPFFEAFSSNPTYEGRILVDRFLVQDILQHALQETVEE